MRARARGEKVRTDLRETGAALTSGLGVVGDAPGIESYTPPSDRRWGIVLAGGDGTRLQQFTRAIYGEARPKQFCSLVGSESLLGQTIVRSEQGIRNEQVLVALKADHEAFYDQEPRVRPEQRIVQPANLGTAPAILICIMSIARIDGDAIVAIMPADHHFSQEGAFRQALERAFLLAGHRTESVILLGAPADRPEVEYGWIEAGAPVGSAFDDVCRVRAFREKPCLDDARVLLQQGALWNTFVMVGHIGAFRSLMKAAMAEVIERFSGGPLWSGKQLAIPVSAYEGLRSIDFSRQILAPNTGRLAALKLHNSGWTDLGKPDRVIAARRQARMRSGIEEDHLSNDSRHLSAHV